MSSIVFPKSFVDKAKKVYPSWNDLHNVIKMGKIQQLSVMLENASGFAVTADDVVSLFRRKKESQLLEQAKKAMERRELYQEYLAIESDFLEKNSQE